MLPDLTTDDVQALIPEAANVTPLGRGGQKLVFRGDLEGIPFALKFVLLPSDSGSEEAVSVVEARALREIETMRRCSSPHMIKVGPLGMTIARVREQTVLYFSEEYVDGADLQEVLRRDGPLDHLEVARLGIEMAEAIGEMWNVGRIHRDIKPQNIMQRSNGGSFVLLDAGYAFDVVGESLSQGGVVGTLPYFPPERFDYGARRTVVDHRSDMFSLGVTMYQMATGVHPFLQPGDGSQQVLTRILAQKPAAPSQHNTAIPSELDVIILRMMRKSPHLRYRSLDQLSSALSGIGA